MRQVTFLKRFNLLAIIGLAAFGISCNSSGTNTTSGGETGPALVVAQSNYTIGASDVKVTLNVTSTDKYEVKSSGAWVIPITTSASTAKSFDLTVKENTGYMDRIDTLTLTSGKLSQTV